MKKDRPGTLVSVLSRMNDVEKLESILFDETGTFGIRKSVVERSKRARREHTVQTAWGPVRGKLGWRQGEECLFTPEFEDCARLAGRKRASRSARFTARRRARFNRPTSHPLSKSRTLTATITERIRMIIRTTTRMIIRTITTITDSGLSISARRNGVCHVACRQFALV